MNIKNTLILFSLILLTFIMNAQDLKVFSLLERSKETVFVSVSDIDHLSEHPDSLSLPDLSDIEKENHKDFNYVKLSSEHRARLLYRTEISETDRIFIYSYLNDTLISIPIKNLNAVAWLNGYTNPAECLCPEYYYQLGFEMDNRLLKDFESDYTNTLVYIGKQNPFVRNQAEPIIWQEIDNTEFPTNSIGLEVNRNFGNNDFEYELGQAYKFEYKKHQVFIQKLLKKNEQFGLRLLILNKETKEKRFEKLYYSGESDSFAPLNYQWIGKLFKNKPMAIFGFQWHTFGCPIIDFIDFEEKPVVINCDNRH